MPDSISRLRLDGGELWMNRSGGMEGFILEYVLGGDPYRPVVRPETLQEDAAKGVRVTKLDIPGIGACVLKEMSTNLVRGWMRRIEIAFRIAFRRKYRRTFQVALAARAAGTDVYEPHAYWYRCSAGGLQMFFLCEFVDGTPFESLARNMAYSPGDRAVVLNGFRMLGGIAARLDAHGILNRDMVPQNCFLCLDGTGGVRMKLIDLDLAYFFRGGDSRLAFVHRMRAFRRFVTSYPLTPECLDAFLDTYTRGNRLHAAQCRKALSIMHRLAKHRILAGLLVWLSCPPHGP